MESAPPAPAAPPASVDKRNKAAAARALKRAREEAREAEEHARWVEANKKARALTNATTAVHRRVEAVYKAAAADDSSGVAHVKIETGDCRRIDLKEFAVLADAVELLPGGVWTCGRVAVVLGNWCGSQYVTVFAMPEPAADMLKALLDAATAVGDKNAAHYVAEAAGKLCPQKYLSAGNIASSSSTVVMTDLTGPERALVRDVLTRYGGLVVTTLPRM
jgi:hypothetical protein